MKQWSVSEPELLDMIVLMSLPFTTFYKISNLFIEEKRTVPGGNRIVYMSKLLEVFLIILIQLNHDYINIRN